MTEIITRNSKAAELTYNEGDNQIVNASRTTAINLTLDETHNREVVVFNGASLVATLTTAATLEAALNVAGAGDIVGYLITLYNLHTSDLRITSATNIDGSSADIFIPQHASITFVYDPTSNTYLTANKPNSIFVTNSNGNPNLSDVQLAASTDLADGAFEEVGPTGSGATNIWAGLDGVPLDVDWLELSIRIDAESSAGPSAGLSVWARSNGSAEAADFDTRIGGAFLTTTGAARINTVSSAKVQVDAANIFELQWSATGTTNDTSEEVVVKVVGYGWNR